MNADHEAALKDLLQVTQLGQITPVRLQRWQAAARELLSVATVPASDEAPGTEPKKR